MAGFGEVVGGGRISVSGRISPELQSPAVHGLQEWTVGRISLSLAGGRVWLESFPVNLPVFSFSRQKTLTSSL